MLSNKKRTTFFWLTSITLLIVLKYNYSSYLAQYFDGMFIIILFFFIWSYLCNYRQFTMTLEKLENEVPPNTPLNYTVYRKYSSKGVNRIWVRPNGYTTWYELDYKVTIPSGSDEKDYLDFKEVCHDTSSLLKYMLHNARRNASIDSYSNFKTRYDMVRNYSLIALILGTAIWVIAALTSYSDSNYVYPTYKTYNYEY